MNNVFYPDFILIFKFYKERYPNYIDKFIRDFAEVIDYQIIENIFEVVRKISPTTAQLNAVNKAAIKNIDIIGFPLNRRKKAPNPGDRNNPIIQKYTNKFNHYKEITKLPLNNSQHPTFQNTHRRNEVGVLNRSFSSAQSQQFNLLGRYSGEQPSSNFAFSILPDPPIIYNTHRQNEGFLDRPFPSAQSQPHYSAARKLNFLERYGGEQPSSNFSLAYSILPDPPIIYNTHRQNEGVLNRPFPSAQSQPHYSAARKLNFLGNYIGNQPSNVFSRPPEPSSLTEELRYSKSYNNLQQSSTPSSKKSKIGTPPTNQTNLLTFLNPNTNNQNKTNLNPNNFFA
jgi:hypothetical protein